MMMLSLLLGSSNEMSFQKQKGTNQNENSILQNSSKRKEKDEKLDNVSSSSVTDEF